MAAKLSPAARVRHSGRHLEEPQLTPAELQCPVCDTQMIRMVDPVQRHIWFEACTACNGVFLDAGEFRDLKQHTLLDHLKDLFTPERH